MMKRTLLAALAVAVTGAFGAAPADAQEFPDYKFDFGVNGGFAWYSDMLDDTHLMGEDSEDVKFESGWITGAQATFWATPMFGIRANGTYTERPLVLGSYSEIGNDASTDIIEDINIWSITGDLMFRPLADGYALGGIASNPYLALGVGAKYFDLAVDNDLGGDVNGQYFTVTQDGQTGSFAIAEEWKLAGLVALGTDLRFADNFGLRLEIGDRFWDSPTRLAEGTPPNLTLAEDPDEDYGKVVHELYATLGAHVLLGLEEPEVVAVAPAPPAPTPTPEPEPEPEPVEEMIQVCVIDPSVEAGIVEVDAIYLPETRDTMVMRNGMRRDFATTVPNVMVANEADWFVRGEPLTITYADDATIEYTTWQSARMIEADNLAFVGMSRGLPVYAATEDVRDIREEWMDARQAAMSNELDDILEENAELAAALEEVQYLYVPLRPTGCVFQTVRIVEQVRKK